MRRYVGVVAGLAFAGCVLLANYLTNRYGLIPVGFGLVTTAGTYLAGLTFILRDLIQDTLGRVWVIVLIVVGAVLSFVVAAPVIALASGTAFFASESADLSIYTPLRERGYIRAALASNVVGSLLDTVIFLTIAGFPVWSSVPGQMVAKMTLTLIAVIGVVMSRALLRNAVVTKGA